MVTLIATELECVFTVSKVIPRLFFKLRAKLGITPNTPMEPVIVSGSATILVAFELISYPAEAATSPIETITGFIFLVLITSLVISSEAMASPPGEFTLKTTALTLLFFAACCRALTMVSLPIESSLPLP